MRFLAYIAFLPLCASALEVPDRAVEECEKFWKAHAAIAARCARGDWSEKRPHGFEEILAAIALTPSGRKIVSPLIAAWEKKQLKLEPLSGETARRLGLRPGDAGGFLFDTVYLDNDVPFIAAAATLLHELVHAAEYLTDPRAEDRTKTARAYERDPGAHREAMTEIVVRGEQRAFRAQDAFLAELVRRDTSLGPVIEETVRHRYLIAFPVSRAQLRAILSAPSGFAISEAHLDRYLEE